MAELWQRALGVGIVTGWLVAGIWETRLPLSQLQLSVARRWTLHFVLWMATGTLVSLLFRVTAIALAASYTPSGIGILGFFLVADLCLFVSHYLMHRFGLLWIWHAIHHSDPDLDASTSLRFHPVEASLDALILLALVFLMRPGVVPVAVYQIAAIASGFFVHANAQLPPRLERALQWVLMTPGLHHSHHSLDVNSQKSNYGIVLTIWDRLAGTLNHNPTSEAVGIEGHSVESTVNPLHLLATLPWREWKKL